MSKGGSLVCGTRLTPPLATACLGLTATRARKGCGLLWAMLFTARRHDVGGSAGELRSGRFDTVTSA